MMYSSPTIRTASSRSPCGIPRSLVNHAETDPLDRALNKRNLPFGPLNGWLDRRPRTGTAEFGGGRRHEVVTAFLPETCLRRIPGPGVVAMTVGIAGLRMPIRTSIKVLQAAMRLVDTHDRVPAANLATTLSKVPLSFRKAIREAATEEKAYTGTLRGGP